MARELSLPHRHMLEVDSGITPGIIAERGYWTATTKQELAALGFSKEQQRVPALVLPMHGVDGIVIGHQIRPDEPRLNDKGKPVKYEFPAGSMMRIDICPNPHIRELLADKRSELWITEGIKKGDSAAARGVCVIAVLGVWNWRGTNALGGSTELADWEKVAIKGRKIFVCFDSDVTYKPEVQAALKRFVAMLKRRGAASVTIIVPHLPGKQGKLGMDDFFALGGVIADLRQCADESILAGRTVVTNNRSLADVAQDGLDAVVEANLPPSVFVRAGELVRVAHDERDIPKIQALTPPALKGVLARSATWIRKSKESETEISPPGDVVDDIMAMPAWPAIPPIMAITRAPVLSASGVLSMAPGYCPDSHFYIACKESWPTWPGDAKSAAEYIFNEVLVDFPFASDADRAHALALMLLPMVRPAIDGSTPLHLIDAPVQGSGKSKLANVCMIPTAGGEIAATPGTKDEEEWRKKIASCLLGGRAYIFLDNLAGKISSASLELALTAREFEDRVLNHTKNLTLPIQCVWMATSNNAELSRDIAERTVWIRLDAEMERPSERKFRHVNIEGWTVENRPKIVSALCAIVLHWVVTGRPACSAFHPRYPIWSSVIGGMLEAAGVTGFLDNHRALASSASTDDGAWLAFMERWWEEANAGFKKAGDLKALFEQDEELAGLLGNGNDAARTTRLGHFLKKRVGVVLGGMRISRMTATTGGSASYQLEAIKAKTPQTPLEKDQTPLDDLNLESGVRGINGVFNPPILACDSASARTCGTEFSNPTTPQTPLGPDLDPNRIIEETIF